MKTDGSGAGVVVCFLATRAQEGVTEGLEALFANTDPAVPVLVVDHGSTASSSIDKFLGVTRLTVLSSRLGCPGIGGIATEVSHLCAGADFVVLSGHAIVAPGWLDRLRSAAYSLPNVASASALTGTGDLYAVGSHFYHGSPALSVQARVAEAAQRVAKVSGRTRPLVPLAVGHCWYIRRAAVTAVADEGRYFACGETAMADFSRRVAAVGLLHVCADDVFVYHHDERKFASNGKQLVGAPAGVLTKHHSSDPLVLGENVRDGRLPASAAFSLARTALRGLRLVVDGTRLLSDTMGTQAVVLESAKALGRHAEVADMTVAVLEGTAPRVLEALEKSGCKVVVSKGPGYRWRGRSDADVVYRPCQVTRMVEFEWLLGIARRVVVCQLDCIAYNNPAYFANWARWAIYKQATQLTFRHADGIAFLSNASRNQATMSGLKAAGAEAIVLAGVDPGPCLAGRSVPEGIPESATGFILCLGASYKHKNRVAALRIWAEARARNWEGGIVLAGPNPPEGNSVRYEDDFLHDHPELKSAVWRLGAVSEAEKEWLYERAALVLYPTLSEGFGLVPFEAARRGVPCLSTRAGALDEILPIDIPGLDPGSADLGASLCLDVLRDPLFSRAVCESLNSRAAEFTWDRTAERLVSLFWNVLGRPSGEQDRVRELQMTRPLAGGPPWGSPGGPRRSAAWATELVVDRPRLRRALVPPRSLRYRVGKAVLRLTDREER